MVNLWRSIRFTVVFAILLGLFYPLAVTAVGNLLFPFQAKGSIVQLYGHPIGSELIAQDVTSDALFHPRPSAVNYAANASGGSNLGPSNPALLSEVKQNLQAVEKQNPGTPVSSIPPDMVESSASGLDPDISVQDALIQVPRIAKASGLGEVYLNNLISEYEQRPVLGIWGDPMINVMRVNLAIEQRLGR
ncbi:potassium-transporting ATPase subunit KdpC [Alicyclobacillus fastidiosus]|uniref:Potassium-transporting ATPase KdpC subunit n=1 Tax=Alicyclobacillus fastidiosus TaxID=392011 RepID=A0ABY6ZEC1_9BACL|nr:potassium-transporting ATPase subunit KdpC [Alicyclobacillus fastidiosus]WAH41243.1 potassium-transporting ATPase subunit KdpC [Alicyclobacillus fastidiosus]GMA62835.1 potassium-transporting ATPase KdpC subunit [Alicyclobacillus fastidiosus]